MGYSPDQYRRSSRFPFPMSRTGTVKDGFGHNDIQEQAVFGRARVYLNEIVAGFCSLKLLLCLGQVKRRRITCDEVDEKLLGNQ